MDKILQTRFQAVSLKHAPWTKKTARFSDDELVRTYMATEFNDRQSLLWDSDITWMLGACALLL